MALRIPKNIFQAIEYSLYNFEGINKLLAEKSESEFAIKAHMAYGKWIKDNWGFSKEDDNLELFFWFLTLGIKHPDDMADIILRSAYRKHNIKNIDLPGQIQHFKDYWESLKDEKEDDDRDDDPDDDFDNWQNKGGWF